MLLEHILDLSRDDNLTNFGKATLEDRYLKPNETSPQHAFLRASTAFSSNEAHATRMYGYASKQWVGYASPILSNAPVRTKFAQAWEDNFGRDCFLSVVGALPISCFLGYVGDSREEIGFHYYETMWLASNGGGAKFYWGDLRPVNSETSTGSKTGGLIPFFHVDDGLIVATHQGNNRRGVDGGSIRDNHPEIVEFIESRKMSGDPNKRSRNLFQTVNLSDDFMYAVLGDKSWDLIDHKGVVTKTVQARYLWELMLETPFETGCPFLHWIDTSNDELPPTQKARGLRTNTVNICTEITLPTDKDRTAVCCLSSINMLKRDEWINDPQFIADVTEFLDNVLEYFIQNAIYTCTKDYDWEKLKDTLRSELKEDNLDEDRIDQLAHKIVERNIMGYKKAVYSAKQERAIGIGMMGLDSYFMANEIAYESQEALTITQETFRHIKAQAHAASVALGTLRGEAPDMEGTGRRNSHLLAIAPTATNSTIAGGATPALEKRYENIYTQKTKSGTFTVVEPALVKVLDKYGINTPEVIKSIKDNNGSVQHLRELTDHERLYLRTVFEVDQVWVVEHAAVAQAEVCQAISCNLFFMPDVPRFYVNNVHLHMWKRGLKSRYYVRTKAVKSGDAFADALVKRIQTIDYKKHEDFDACPSCEG